jgi:hypothetical protein
MRADHCPPGDVRLHLLLREHVPACVPLLPSPSSSLTSHLTHPVYTNTLVATLNARRTIRGANGNTVLDESTSGGTGSHSTNNLNLSLAKMGAGNKGMPTRVSISRSRGEIQGPMVVKVDREVHRDVSVSV